MPKPKTAVVIGAGVGGLAAANLLAKAGLEVTVYEKNSIPGGRMGQLKKHGFTFDTGPSWYLMKDVFEQYFSLFGKRPSDYYDLVRLDPGYKVFFEASQPITITTNFQQNLRTFEKRQKGAAQTLQAYVKQGQQNYQAALKYFLYNPFRRFSNLARTDVLRQMPSFASLFGQSLHSFVSKRFKQLELQQILEYPSVFLGASPFNTPALYQLMSYLDFKEGVFYPKQGMYSLTEALSALGQELGVKYLYNSPAQKIISHGGQAIGVKVGEKEVKADIVISNADLHFTETQLLDPAAQSYSAGYWQKRTAGPSALLLYLGVKGSLPELEHHNLFFVKHWQKNFDQIYKDKTWPDQASMYVSKTTATDPSTAPKGHENLFVLVPLPPGVTATDTDVNHYVDHYLGQLETMSGISDLRTRVVYKEVRQPEYFGEAFNSWQNSALGMSHTLRQTAFLRPSVKSKKLRNLYYVGAGSQPGIGVPMCLISAQLVYKHLAQDWSAGPVSIIKRLDA